MSVPEHVEGNMDRSWWLSDSGNPTDFGLIGIVRGMENLKLKCHKSMIVFSNSFIEEVPILCFVSWYSRKRKSHWFLRAWGIVKIYKYWEETHYKGQQTRYLSRSNSIYCSEVSGFVVPLVVNHLHLNRKDSYVWSCDYILNSISCL